MKEATDNYSVSINRRDGIIEISGPDKDWVKEQLAAALREDAASPAQVRSRPARKRSTRSAAAAGPSSEEGGAAGARARKRASTGRTTRVPELEEKLTKEAQAALQGYRDEREDVWKPHSSQAAIIATFLQDQLGIEAIGPGELYTTYSVMGWESPSNFKKQIENAQQRSGYFGGYVDGKVQLTHKGENFARQSAQSKN